MTPLIVALWVLATWSLTRLLAADEMPLVDAARRRMLPRIGESGRYLFRCFFCLSFWCGYATLAVVDVAGVSVPAVWWALGPLAARLLVGIGDLLEDVIGNAAGHTTTTQLDQIVYPPAGVLEEYETETVTPLPDDADPTW